MSPPWEVLEFAVTSLLGEKTKIPEFYLVFPSCCITLGKCKSRPIQQCSRRETNGQGSRYTPRDLPLAEPETVGANQEQKNEFCSCVFSLCGTLMCQDLPPRMKLCAQESIESESTSSVHSKTSDSDTDSTTSVDERCRTEFLVNVLPGSFRNRVFANEKNSSVTCNVLFCILFLQGSLYVLPRRSQPPAPQSGEVDAETVLENVEVNVKNYWEDESHGERSNLTTSRLSQPTSSPSFQGQIDPIPTGQNESSKAGDRATLRRLQLSKANGQNRWKRLRFVRHLWIALVGASFVELCLISSGLLVDYFWSPCRTELDTCRHLHELDCWGRSCQEFAPLWASAWPAAGLLFLALPLKFFLRTDKRLGCTQAVPAVVPVLTSFAVCLLGVVGVGAIVLVESATAALHYADRCPMRRVTPSSRCTAELCPSPPCRRESDFSPCLCGPLGEAELARALFLQGTPACQPYEWYTWQMKLLEELMLQYEEFACILGPLTCVATAVGGALLLIQLACCPLVLIGQWGGHAAICVLLGYLDFEDVPFPSGGISPLQKSSAFNSAPSMSLLNFGKETSRDGDAWVETKVQSPCLFPVDNLWQEFDANTRVEDTWYFTTYCRDASQCQCI